MKPQLCLQVIALHIQPTRDEEVMRWRGNLVGGKEPVV